MRKTPDRSGFTRLRVPLRRGFTLVELLMCIAILVLLIAFIINVFDPLEQRGEAYDAERNVHARMIYKAINDYLWSGQFVASDFPAEGEKKWICDGDLTGSACTQTATGVDLSFLVTQEYMSAVPEDPVYANAKSTGFQLTLQGDYYTVIAAFKGVYDPPPDPIARWNLDDTTIGTAAEEMGGYDGTHTGMGPGYPATEFVYAHVENQGSLEFDGSNDYINVVNPTDLDFGDTTDFTISAWFKRKGTGLAYIMNKGDANAAHWLRFEANDTLQFFLNYGATADATQTAATYTDTNWHHVAAVADRDEYLRIYVDGSQVAEDASMTGGDISNDFNLTIGYDATNTQGPFEGYLDDVRLYEQALSANQVLWISQGLF